MPVRAHWITFSVDIFLLVHILLLAPPIPHRDLLHIPQDRQVYLILTLQLVHPARQARAAGAVVGQLADLGRETRQWTR